MSVKSLHEMRLTKTTQKSDLRHHDVGVELEDNFDREVVLRPIQAANEQYIYESEPERDTASIIQQAIIETEAKGFSVARQLAFVQFLTSINDLNLSLFSELVLQGMLNLIVTIVRMHCSNHLVGTTAPKENSEVLVQNRQLGIKAAEILLKLLTSDDRTLQLLNPDRIMLHGFNLGRLIESPDVDEKNLGLTLSLFFLRNDPEIVISDICSNEQIRA